MFHLLSVINLIGRAVKEVIRENVYGKELLL
jgi:hypothetical protein